MLECDSIRAMRPQQPDSSQEFSDALPLDGLRELLTERAMELGVDPAAIDLERIGQPPAIRPRPHDQRKLNPTEPATYREKLRIVRYLAPGGPTLEELESWPADLVAQLAVESLGESFWRRFRGDVPSAEDFAGVMTDAKAERLEALAREEPQRRRQVRQQNRRYNLLRLWGTDDPAAIADMRAEFEAAYAAMVTVDAGPPERTAAAEPTPHQLRLARRARVSLMRLERLVGDGQLGVSREAIKAARILANEAGALKNNVDPDGWRIRKRRRRGLNRKVRPSARQSVFEASAGLCRYCGKPADTIDHVVPRVTGGPNAQANLVACCHACNQAKADRTPAEWAADILAAVETAEVTP